MSYSDVLRAPRSIDRAPAEDIAAFADAPVGNIVDAIGRTGAMDAPIKAITQANRFAGSALTVDAGPRDNLAPWAALRLAKPGDVMVITTGGHMASSVCGDLLIGMARNAGIVAIVTDGVVRDTSGANAVGIPVFAAGVSPNSPQKNGPGAVGLPIVAGDVSVAAGDIVCGDEDGVVVIPSAQIASAKAELANVRAKEASMEQAVSSGATAPGWLADLPLDDIFSFTE
ncbi:regulator of RNase E activity RraA [Aliiruegeria haliotis]|uniref:Putative 4-hydroxy-4-methyl-2-oxoglutarate aldolase n=1 Tax=Aliiruegeria haliotis TaxID=1280846 RepID=A0A2T0RLQ4_9RHOB|nr:aldolase [Aliiruegeria haliotis]PRY22125.1 regulator of RNase E activity RraA [Aliiruegeria haliotis]